MPDDRPGNTEPDATTTVTVAEPDGYRVTCKRRPTLDAEDQRHGRDVGADIPGELHLTGDEEASFHHVAIRELDSSAVVESWAILVPGSGTWELSELPQYDLGDATDGISLIIRVSDLEAQGIRQGGKLDEHNAELERIDQRADGLDEQVEDLAEAFFSLNGAVANVQVQARDNAQDIGELSGRVDDHEVEIEDLGEQVAQNTAELGNNVFARLEAHEAALWEAEMRIDDSDSAIAALETLLADVEGVQIDTTAGTRVTLNGAPVFYDSGWRDFSECLSDDLRTGTFYVRRTLTDLYYSFDDIGLPSGSGWARVATSIPTAWQPRDARNGFVIARNNNSSYRQYMSTVAGSTINWIGESHPQSETPPTATRPSAGLTGSWTFAPREEIPASLPGTTV